MKKYLLIQALCMSVTLIVSHKAFAKEETQSVLSQKCDQQKLKKLAGAAAIKIEKGSWDGGYNITLNTEKMSFNDLLQKMAKEGCN